MSQMPDLGGARPAALHLFQDHVLGCSRSRLEDCRITGEDGKAAEWELAAQEIKEDILANGVDDRGC